MPRPVDHHSAGHRTRDQDPARPGSPDSSHQPDPLNGRQRLDPASRPECAPEDGAGPDDRDRGDRALRALCSGSQQSQLATEAVPEEVYPGRLESFTDSVDDRGEIFFDHLSVTEVGTVRECRPRFTLRAEITGGNLHARFVECFDQGRIVLGLHRHRGEDQDNGCLGVGRGPDTHGDRDARCRLDDDRLLLFERVRTPGCLRHQTTSPCTTSHTYSNVNFATVTSSAFKTTALAEMS